MNKPFILLLLTFGTSACNSFGDNVDASISQFVQKPVQLMVDGDQRFLILNSWKESTLSPDEKLDDSTYLMQFSTSGDQLLTSTDTMIDGWIHPNQLTSIKWSEDTSCSGWTCEIQEYTRPLQVFKSSSESNYVKVWDVPDTSSYEPIGITFKSDETVRVDSNPSLNLYAMAQVFPNGDLDLTLSIPKLTDRTDLVQEKTDAEIATHLGWSRVPFCMGEDGDKENYICSKHRLSSDALGETSVSATGVRPDLSQGYPYWDLVPQYDQYGDTEDEPSPWWTTGYLRVDVAWREKGAPSSQVFIQSFLFEERARPIKFTYYDTERNEVDWEKELVKLDERSTQIDRSGEQLWIKVSPQTGKAGSSLDHYDTHLIGFSDQASKLVTDRGSIALPQGEGCGTGYFTANGSYYWLYSQDLVLRIKELHPDGTTRDEKIRDESDSDGEFTGCAITGTPSGGFAVAYSIHGYERPSVDNGINYKTKTKYLEWEDTTWSDPIHEQDFDLVVPNYSGDGW